MSLKEIANGVKNSVIKNDEIEKDAARKAAICEACDHSKIKNNWCAPRVQIISEVTGQKVWRSGGCGCLLYPLHRSNKPCTKGKF